LYLPPLFFGDIFVVFSFQDVSIGGNNGAFAWVTQATDLANNRSNYNVSASTFVRLTYKHCSTVHMFHVIYFHQLIMIMILFFSSSNFFLSPNTQPNTPPPFLTHTQTNGTDADLAPTNDDDNTSDSDDGNRSGESVKIVAFTFDAADRPCTTSSSTVVCWLSTSCDVF
jgi:hypothetical protein